jgi:hypothetical protein
LRIAKAEPMIAALALQRHETLVELTRRDHPTVDLDDLVVGQARIVARVEGAVVGQHADDVRRLFRAKSRGLFGYHIHS